MTEAKPRATAPQPSEVTRAPSNRTRDALGDLRFCRLLGMEQWSRLAPAVRQRFGKRLDDGRTVVYTGTVVECRMTRLGWLLAQLARLLGGPLPTSRDGNVPTVVSVTEDAAARGQLWTRVYGRRRGFPQVIHSSKRFAGPTGLEEYLGCGFGMALTAHVTDGVLQFRSRHYYLQLAGRRLRLPGWLLPVTCTVSHVDRGGGTFAFVLEVGSSAGELIGQTAVFRD